MILATQLSLSCAVDRPMFTDIAGGHPSLLDLDLPRPSIYTIRCAYMDRPQITGSTSGPMMP